MATAEAGSRRSRSGKPADGVLVGSTNVQRTAQRGNDADAAAGLEAFVRPLGEAAHGKGV